MHNTCALVNWAVCVCLYLYTFISTYAHMYWCHIQSYPHMIDVISPVDLETFRWNGKATVWERSTCKQQSNLNLCQFIFSNTQKFCTFTLLSPPLSVVSQSYILVHVSPKTWTNNSFKCISLLNCMEQKCGAYKQVTR